MGRKLLVLALLLATLGAAGAYNYRRNLAAEENTPRPYRGYDDRDIEALTTAYAAEIDQLRARYEDRSSQRVDAGRRNYLDEGIREFNRVRRESARTRALAGQLAEQEAELRELEREQQLRARDRGPLQPFLRRLLTI